MEAFRAFYGLDAEALYRRRFRPSYLLIYGRRSEASARPALTAKRSHLFPEDVVGMTYDRLWPDQNASQLICIKARAAGEFTAVSVPPTLEWSPVHAEDRSQIIGFDAAIAANQYIGRERKEFLVRRLPYWNAWASQRQRGIHSNDSE